MMKSKPKCLVLLVFLLYHRASPSVPDVDESQVKSWVVNRRPGEVDLFTINLKKNVHCYHEWCQLKFMANYVAAPACSCTCNSNFPSFIPSMKTCINVTMAASFGDCKFAYFDNQNLLNNVVNLGINDKKNFSISTGDSCSLSRDYFVHDYTGFKSKWELKNDGFFHIEMKSNHFNITWAQDTSGRLSGRIIRLSVTCTTTVAQGQAVSSFTHCILLKAQGAVTYYATRASPSADIGHSSPVRSHVPLSSAASSSVTKSLLLSATLTVSTSLALSPPSTSDRSSSSFPHQPPSLSVSSASSALSPLPSLVLTSSTGTLQVPQSDSSFLPLTQTQTARLPALTSAQIQATTSAVIVPTEPAETMRVVSSSSASDSGPGSKGSQTSGNDNGVVIGAAVGGAVVLGILVIIFVVFWKRRKAWESTEKQAQPVKNPVYGSSSDNEIQLEVPKGSKAIPLVAQDNQPTYQSLINDNEGQSNGAAIYSSAEDDYDNCNVYQSLDKQIPGSPVYGKLNKGLPEPAHTTGLPKTKPKAKTSAAGIPTSRANGVTGLPKPKPPSGQPSNRPIVAQENVYNALEGTDSGQDYEAPKIEPLYNVLEGPNSRQDIPKNGPSSAQEPLYNVLEGPDAINAPIDKQGAGDDSLYNVLERPEASHESGAPTTQEPLYNVLEVPDGEKSPLVAQDTAGPSNEPLYNVLDGPDSDGSEQGAPKEPISSAAHDNPAYEQTLEFDTPYADVHRAGMQRESVYEPLRGPAQEMYESVGRT